MLEKLNDHFSQGMRYKHQATFSRGFVVLKDRVSKSLGVWHVLSTSHVFTLSLEEFYRIRSYKRRIAIARFVDMSRFF